MDGELRQRARRLESDFFAFCELAAEAIDGAYYVKFGYMDFEDYCTERLGVSYRSLRRRLTVLDAVRALPAKDQDDAKTALADVGIHKSAVLAPALRSDAAGWRDWVKTAATETVEGLQRKVTTALGLKPRGPTPDAPGARFLAYILNQVPPDSREEVEAVFEAGKVVAESDNAVQVFLCMVRECRVEWAHRATPA